MCIQMQRGVTQVQLYSQPADFWRTGYNQSNIFMGTPLIQQIHTNLWRISGPLHDNRVDNNIAERRGQGCAEHCCHGAVGRVDESGQDGPWGCPQDSTANQVASPSVAKQRNAVRDETIWKDGGERIYFQGVTAGLLPRILPLIKLYTTSFWIN